MTLGCVFWENLDGVELDDFLTVDAGEYSDVGFGTGLMC